MKRIMILSDYADTGGTGLYLKYLVEYLRYEYDIRLVLHKNKTNCSFLPWFSDKGIKISYDYISCPRLDHLIYRVFRKMRIEIFYSFIRDSFCRIKLERKYKPEIIIVSQGGGLNYFPFLLSKYPVFFIIHSLFTSSIKEKYFGAFYTRFYKKIDTANKIVCSVSAYAVDIFLKNILIPKLSECSVCIPSYGREMICKEKKNSVFIKVLTLGHVVGYKNPEIWLNVAMEILNKYPGRVSFIWVGNGELLGEMVERTKNIEGISFIGFREEVDSLYGDADIYFQPSVWESQGISVVEAMGCSLPCIVSNAGGLPESIEDGVEGFVCDVFDTAKYVEAFSTLIDNYKIRFEFGRNARKKFESKFSKDVWIEKMDKVFSSLHT